MAHGLEFLICLRFKSLQFDIRGGWFLVVLGGTYEIRFSMEDSAVAVLMKMRKASRFGAWPALTDGISDNYTNSHAPEVEK